MNEWPKTVRTKMRPDLELQVNEPEYIDLERQGLLMEEPAGDGKARAPREREN